MIKAFQLHHSTATDSSYRSVGARRTAQTHCIFHYTIKGHGEVIYQGVPYRTKAGEGFFNIINEADSGYGYPEDETEQWEFIVVCFKDGNVREVVKELLETAVVYTVPNREYFGKMCKKLLDNMDGTAGVEFFPLLVSMIYHAKKPVARMSQTFQYIVEEELLRNPAISEIAERMNLSREHLQREYRKQTGKTPARYISDRRFERLCELLTTSRSEAEIADIMHFASIAEMRLFFRKYAGMTPRQYRSKGYLMI